MVRSGRILEPLDLANQLMPPSMLSLPAPLLSFPQLLLLNDGTEADGKMEFAPRLHSLVRFKYIGVGRGGGVRGKGLVSPAKAQTEGITVERKIVKSVFKKE